jgi:AcrR family transcriptional regulator
MKAAVAKSKEEVGSGVRRGTATRRAGKETAARLVAAAHEQLEVETLERFSMRSVAERAGVSLANLQYYFPRREDLLRALYQDLDSRYRAAYKEALAQAPEDPVERFQVVLEYNMRDIRERSTRQFFIQLWALLGAIDDFAGHYIGELYAIDIAHLGEHIKAMQPEACSADIERRATLIASMIEGLMLTTGDSDGRYLPQEELLQSAREAAMAIALG